MRTTMTPALLALLASTVLGADAQPAGVPGALNGEAAIAALGPELEAVARRHDLTGEQLAMALATDSSMFVTADGDVFHVCPAAPKPENEAQVDGDRTRSGVLLTDAFGLSSDPGNPKTIYLDFTGHHSVNNQWGHDIVFPPFTRDGNSAAFSSSELAEIIGTWEQMVEDFAPFNVNVTTVEPPIDALIKSDFNDVVFGVRCIFTQATDGFGNGTGGIAFLNSFDNNSDDPVFAFNKGTLNGGMTGSHEVGHSLGLLHDGLNTSEYHPGTGSSSSKTSWGPIMGAPFSRNVVHWSEGDYTGATNTEDDLTRLARPAMQLGYVPDDHGDDFASATSLAPGAPVNGLINLTDDVDVFAFASPCGEFTFSAVPHDPGTNVDLLMQVFDASGTLLGTYDDTNQVSASLTLELPAGTFYVSLDGVGHPTRYSQYGSVGNYLLTATTVGSCPCVADLDSDGDADIDDIALFTLVMPDVTGDTAFNIDDITAFIDSFASGCN